MEAPVKFLVTSYMNLIIADILVPTDQYNCEETTTFCVEVSKGEEYIAFNEKSGVGLPWV